jgi:hypothetical protein
MKTYYRGRVKYDSDPENSYNDGYNAARRYGKTHTSTGMVVYCTVAGMFIGALSLNLYNLLK